MKEFDLVLEHLDEFYNTAVPNIESAIERQYARVVFGIQIKLGDIFRTNEETSILRVGIHGWDNSNALTASDRKGGLGDGKFCKVTIEFL
jgi:hypothetical protein